MRYRIGMHIDYYYDVMLALDPINQSKSRMFGQRMSCGVISLMIQNINCLSTVIIVH